MTIEGAAEAIVTDDLGLASTAAAVIGADTVGLIGGAVTEAALAERIERDDRRKARS